MNKKTMVVLVTAASTFCWGSVCLGADEDSVESMVKSAISANANKDPDAGLPALPPMDPETQKISDDQQKVSLENLLEDERLRKRFSQLRSDIQQVRWEKELLEEQLALEKLKREDADKETVRKYEDALKTLQQENNILNEKLLKAETEYKLSQHEITKQNEETLAKLTAEKSQLQEQLDIERLKREKVQQEAKLEYDEKVAELSREKNLLSEELTMLQLRREKEQREATIAFEDQMTALTRQASLAKARAGKLKDQLLSSQSQSRLQIVALESEIDKLEMQRKRKAYIDSEPVYRDDPLDEKGALIVSDRRISLNGVIRKGTADYITSRINYYNNVDDKLPIFIVIDDSPGGSVMEGYRILKAMEGSAAPVYVVVKSYAASMAAAIAALAEKSYTYPNAVFVHHQLSQFLFFASLNLTQQKELHEQSQRWWKRLAQPIADKMGISTDEFIKQMYENSSDGDWVEFGTEAQKLKWVDTVVTRIRETSLLKDPNLEQKKFMDELEIFMDDSGKPGAWLPRLSPMDQYYLHNPDRYYQLR